MQLPSGITVDTRTLTDGSFAVQVGRCPCIATWLLAGVWGCIAYLHQFVNFIVVHCTLFPPSSSVIHSAAAAAAPLLIWQCTYPDGDTCVGTMLRLAGGWNGPGCTDSTTGLPLVFGLEAALPQEVLAGEHCTPFFYGW